MSMADADPLVLALDMGSSSARSALFDNRGRCLHGTEAAEKYAIDYGSDGRAELSPVLLRRAVTRIIRKSLGRRRVSLFGASSFWHGLLGLDRKWEPVTPIYTWADIRASEAAQRLRRKLDEPQVHARTGCRIHSSFWPARLVWLRENQPGAFRRVAFWVSPIDWILRDLFGTSGSSDSMASATGLYDLRRQRWDGQLCRICEVDPSQLLAVQQPARASSGKLKVELRIAPPIGDGAAGNLGSDANLPGTIAINVGTSAAVRATVSNTVSPSPKIPLGLFRYLLDRDRSIVGGAVSNAGNLRQWALRELRLEKNGATNRLMFARAAAANDSLTVLPFWAGERAPTWPDQQHGVIDGVTQMTKASDIMRALTCGVFYRLGQILDLLSTVTGAAERIIVSGGILQSTAAVRLLADALGHDVEMAREREASLRGAAVYALQQSGINPPRPRRGKRIEHDPKLAQKHRARRARQIALEKLFLNRVDRALRARC